MTTILVTGKTGQLGFELQHALAGCGDVIACDRTELDLGHLSSIRQKIQKIQPDIIVNAAAYTAVDKAEAEPDIATRINGEAVKIMAEEAKRLGALLVHYSTEYVFDGARVAPYSEEDTPNPINVYGKSKLQGEHAITESGCAHLIFRTSWVYSGRGSNFVLTILKLAQERSELPVVNDQIGAPTWARALANATAAVLAQTPSPETYGLYHLSARGHASRFQLTQKIIGIARALWNNDTQWANVRPVKTADYPLPATRPPNSVLNNEKIKRVFGIEMEHWETQLASCLRDAIRVQSN